MLGQFDQFNLERGPYALSIDRDHPETLDFSESWTALHQIDELKHRVEGSTALDSELLGLYPGRFLPRPGGRILDDRTHRFDSRDRQPVRRGVVLDQLMRLFRIIDTNLPEHLITCRGHAPDRLLHLFTVRLNILLTTLDVADLPLICQAEILRFADLRADHEMVDHKRRHTEQQCSCDELSNEHCIHGSTQPVVCEPH